MCYFLLIHFNLVCNKRLLKNILKREKMKKLIFTLPVLALVFMIFTGQKSDDKQNNSSRWNPDPRMTRVYPSGQYVQLPNDYNVSFSKTPRIIVKGDANYIVSPNFMVHPSFGTQSEVPITRHPTNPNIMFGSANTYRGGSSGLSTGVYVTTDGGISWYGSDTLASGSFNYGDPGPVIDKNGRFIISFISLTGTIATSYSTDNGITWAPNVVIPGSTTNSDKNFSGTDDVPTSPYYGRSYTVYTEFSGTYTNRVVLSYSTDGAQTWSSVAPASNVPVAQHFHQGADVKVGPNGEVYVTWANNNQALSSLEDSLGFAKSTNGGVNWVVQRSDADNMNGIRTDNFAPFGIRVNGFPRLDVDKTNGPRRGWIYAVSSEKFVAPATDYADVILHKSTDGGNTWSAVRVNQDTPGNGKAQYISAVNVDEQGGVNIVYYDTRNSTANDSAQIYISRSLDGGVTFEDILVSDHKFKPKAIPGLAGGYQGDYIGITSGNGKLWPYWCEDISGLYQAWTASVGINLAPLNSFNITSPSANSTIVSYPNSQTPVTFNWDTSTATASYKWIFGNPTTSTRKITLPVPINFVNVTQGQLDNILAGLGVAVGDSLVGQWDVWAFRNNLSQDSLKSSNGPRAVTLKRGIPPLRAFNLISPPAGTTILTSSFDFSDINFRWTSSGPGVSYKWKFGSPAVSNVKLSYSSNITGIDSSFTIKNNILDAALTSIGLNPGDSISGEWSVWAYNGFDSSKATQNYSIKMKRQPKGDFLVLYDSTLANCRISKDSVTANLQRLNYTFDLYNRKGNAATNSVSFKGYKYLISLGEGSSVMSNAIKDSVRTYLASGGTGPNKAKLIIMSEDVGYHFDRVNSIYYDSAFARSTLGFEFVADRPGVGGKDITGVTINIGLTDSTYGPSPDVIKRSSSLPLSSTYNLYKYTVFTDSMNAVGRLNTNYNVAVMASDAESIRPSVLTPTSLPLKRVLYGLIQFVKELPTSNEPENTTSIPLAYSLSQNYPNPFNPSTVISYSLPAAGFVSLKIYDITGKEVTKLVNQKLDAGRYETEFFANSLASGMYFYKLEAGDFTETKRMILIK
jgi:hypothetical protein